MKKPGISVCFVIRNGMRNGYPFWESLNSCLDFADEIVISEGHSDDDTYVYMEKFRYLHPEKVKLFRTNWKKSAHGEVIATVSSEALKRCSHEWVYYLQADEIIHEDNWQFIKGISEGKQGKVNSVKFMFNHFIGSWTPLPKGAAAYSAAIRMVRNVPSISLMGDAWTFEGGIDPVVAPTMPPKPIYHLGWVFPKNCDEKSISHAKIYSSMPAYQEQADKAKKRQSEGYDGEVGLPKPDNFDDFPIGVERLLGMFEYEPPDEAK
jgi:glycosyltransferase involved in cell wall biosynthesis